MVVAIDGVAAEPDDPAPLDADSGDSYGLGLSDSAMRQMPGFQQEVGWFLGGSQIVTERSSPVLTNPVLLPNVLHRKCQPLEFTRQVDVDDRGVAFEL